MKTKNNITLIGMPAVGKSTVGIIIAGKLGYKFIDSDDLIQQNERQTLSQIISQKGLSRFLEIEESNILGIDCDHHVIATGGSVIYKNKAMIHLKKISKIVYLSIDLKTLGSRLDDMTCRGVAIDPGRTIEDLYKERTPLYDQYCDMKINCRNMPAERVADEVMKCLS